VEVNAETDPEYPALHEHPTGTATPLELDGQVTEEHDPVKKGFDDAAMTEPEKPELQVQPPGTLAPFEPCGHATAEQEDV
jgi:hypothetical protein